MTLSLKLPWGKPRMDLDALIRGKERQFQADAQTQKLTPPPPNHDLLAQPTSQDGCAGRIGRVR